MKYGISLYRYKSRRRQKKARLHIYMFVAIAAAAGVFFWSANLRQTGPLCTNRFESGGHARSFCRAGLCTDQPANRAGSGGNKT